MNEETRDRLAHLARMAAKYVNRLAAEWPEATPYPEGVDLPDLDSLSREFDALASDLEAPVPVAPTPVPALPPDPIVQEFDDWLNGSD